MAASRNPAQIAERALQKHRQAGPEEPALQT